MAEGARLPMAVAGAPRVERSAAALAAVLLAAPVAVAAAVAVLITGGGIVVAFLAYCAAGIFILGAAAMALTLPRRLVGQVRVALSQAAPSRLPGLSPARLLER